MNHRPGSEARRHSVSDTRVSESVEQIAAHYEVPVLTLVAHSDYRRVGEIVTLAELNSGQRVELSRSKPLFAVLGSARVRPLDVPYLSRTPLLLVSGAAGEVALDRAGSTTPASVDGEALDAERLLTANDLARGVAIELGGRVVLLLQRQAVVAFDDVPRFGLVGDSGPMLRLRREIEMAAKVVAPVILRGLSGTGKELVARAIHNASRRKDKAWIAVNMAAIPPTLAASALFGAAKGAYTGADRPQEGYFAAADGGTLFLDEIGDTPPEIQPLLLRALESGEIQPVGSTKTRKVDVRVITATDSDLEAHIADGRFRASLLHRLAGFEIHLPSLAERRSDIGRLLYHFLNRELEGTEAALGPPADRDAKPWPPVSLVARLVRYDWPGNVRQLANVARRLAVARMSGYEGDLAAFIEPMLIPADPAKSRPVGGAEATDPALPLRPPGPSAASTSGKASPTGRWRPVYRDASEVGEEELIEALRANNYKLNAAAESLGISRAKLYALIERCDRVRKAADLGADEIDQTMAREEGDLEAAARALEVSLHGLRMRMKSLGLR